MFKLQDIIGLVRLGLENFDSLSEGGKKIRVIDLYIINEDTLSCNFFSYSANSVDIKMEIASIMGFFNGFFRNDGFEEISFAHYGVRAFDSNNVELLYAMSSKTTAELLGKGNSIDWLKSTYFQENTEDYRLAQAKKIIAEIENSLRALVTTKLSEQFGDNWWDKSLDNKLGKEIKQTYVNQFDIESNDGNILIFYTYTLQLKKIISTHFNLFKQYFDSLVDFGIQMDNLNKIRREEAHNRSISENNLTDLHHLHERLTSKLLMELTTFQSGYLTENWRMKIKKIITEGQYKSIYDPREILEEKDLSIQLKKTSENLEHLIAFLDDTIIKLESISTPVHKKAIQRNLVTVLQKFKNFQVELLQSLIRLDDDAVKIVLAQIKDYKFDMDNFAETFLLNES